MIYDKARDLAKAMAESEEYVSYKMRRKRPLRTTPPRRC